MKMEVEFTDEQYEKVKLLEENGMSVGEAIETLFEMKEAVSVQTSVLLENRIDEVNQEKATLEQRMNELDEKMSIFSKLKDTSLDVGQKQKIVENEYGRINKTYDESLQDAKHRFKWTKSFFKF